MDTKYSIFVIISALLVAAIYSYSSSIFFVSAATTSCSATSKTTTTCVVQDDKGLSAWDCKLNKDGKTWSCKQAKTMTGGSIPPELTDSLTVATEDTQNNTKVPKTDLLNDGGLLKDDDTADTSNDTKVPKDLGGLNDDDGLTINPDLQ